MAPNALRTAKRQLRRWALGLTPRTPERQAGLAAQLRPLLAAHAPRVLALYIALPSEPDPGALLEELWQAGVVTALPRIESGEIQLRGFERGDPLLPGALGVLQPPPTGAAIEAAAVDVFLIPGLCFDRSGRRLGRGLGYYDRLLGRARRDAVRIALCWSEQLVETVPTGPLDQPVDHVVTELAAHRAPPR